MAAEAGKKKKKLSFKKKVGKTKLMDDDIAQLKQRYQNIDITKIKTFEDFPLSQETQKALTEYGFETPTEIQRETLALCLRGLDILGAAKTGSGKTLAFLIPLIEKLYCLKWTPADGLGALVITPTRELAYQIFETLRKIGKYHDFSAGLVIGGKDLKFERDRLSHCNIIICTPGRILHHMDENPGFDPGNLRLLILDEADRILDLGFEKTMNGILENLPGSESRQTLLFSATQTRSVKDLARLSLEKPVYVSVHERADKATPDQLTQSHIVCELHEKINMLWSFIKSHKRKKLLVFMQSCKQVKYVHELFKRLKCNTTLLALHGKLHQLRRMAIYDEFCQRDSAVVLLATDVAARGLDFPCVDWVIQMDCPEDAKTYLHRAGRTARASALGQSLLVLLPSEEQGMLRQLRIHRIPIDKIHIDPKKMIDMQRKIQAHLASDSELKASAQRAFLAYIKSVYLLKNKEIFDVSKLDTDKFAHSFGLAVPPRIRFLQRLGKKPKKLEEAAESSEDEEEEDLLTVKRSNHDIEEGDVITEEIAGQGNESRVKVVTKAAVAKKILKKNIKANQKIMFDDEGQVKAAEGVSQKHSKEGQDYDLEEGGGGIDLVKARAMLKAEDFYDRKLAKEKKKAKKRELKEKQKRGKEDDSGGESSGEESDNLDWLPDPDEIYGKETDSTEQEPKRKSSKEPPKKKAKKAKEGDLEDLALKLLTG